MLRYTVPVLLFAAAAYVWHYNQTHEGAFMLFPFLDLISSLEGDLPAQADLSWKILAAIGGFVLVLNIGSDLRSKRRSTDTPTNTD